MHSETNDWKYSYICTKGTKMLTKEKIKKTIDLMPENVTIDELINRIILLDKIEQGLDDVEKGNVYTTEEVENKLNKWLK